MKTKKLLSLLLALMMMLSVVPMYASAAEALSASSVTQWPTLSYKNADGKMYFGQTEAEALIINDDEIVIDAAGNQVAGHFTFKDVDKIPTNGTGKKLNLTFVPDNLEEYTGFNKMFSSVLYDVETVTPVPVDENDTIPVAAEVEAGATLSTSTLSGARYINPYNANESGILAREWEWSATNPSYYTVINESGYYEALFAHAGYTPIYKWVLVRIKGDTSEVKMSTKITELPTIDGKVVVGDNWSDVKLIGGKAVGMNGEEVSGIFSILRTTPINNASNYSSDITFTPDDERYASSIATISVTVEPAPIKFVDSNGTETVPEITVPYGTKLKDGDMAYYISQAGCTVVAGKDGCYYGATDADGYIFGTSGSGEAPEVGTHYYEFIARPYTTVGVTSNYEETVLKLKVNVTPLEAEMKLDTTPIKGTDGFELWVWHKDTNVATNPQGTFTVYLDGAVYKDNVKYGEHFTWQPAESKVYEFKATYTPVENDPFTIADFTLTRDIKLTRKLTASENILSGYGDFKYGTAVEISANLTAENFAGWKITDAQGNEVTLDGVDNSSRKITITMPDYDIHVEALEKGATGGDDSTGDDSDGGLGDLTQGDSDNPIVNIFNNIIAWFKNIINTIIEMFRSIGDNS